MICENTSGGAILTVPTWATSRLSSLQKVAKRTSKVSDTSDGRDMGGVSIDFVGDR